MFLITKFCLIFLTMLLIIDIDFFKKINDTYGHQAGDNVLRELATIIQQNTRDGDLTARIGGENCIFINNVLF